MMTTVWHFVLQLFLAGQLGSVGGALLELDREDELGSIEWFGWNDVWLW